VPTATLVTWNLKGSENPDTRAVAAHLRAAGADVVALQEVQWHQARRIARALEARSHHWSMKHVPARTWPEGMAVIGVTARVRVRCHALTFPLRLWDWRRRIVQVATVDDTSTLVNVHLSPHSQAERRDEEAAQVLALAADRTGPVVVAGDFNERPPGPVGEQMAAAGFRDGWASSGPPPEPPAPRADPWPTNWRQRQWTPGTTAPPTQHLDYVYVSSQVEAVTLRLPEPEGERGWARFSLLSDHLPVTATLEM
jgi:endonuclease/exonuclease/phosphatase family metal-dependent hydrolase